jgi:hypothetical protein
MGQEQIEKPRWGSGLKEEGTHEKRDRNVHESARLCQGFLSRLPLLQNISERRATKRALLADRRAGLQKRILRSLEASDSMSAFTEAEIQAMTAQRAADEEAELAAAGQDEKQHEPDRRPLQIDISPFSGTAYLSGYPPRYDWLLDKSLRRSCLGTITGPPGAGKGTFAVQFAIAVAAGEPFLDIWQVPEPGISLYLSAEDDVAVIHRRVHHALKLLPKGKQDVAAANFYGVAVHGRVNLCHGERGAGVKTTLHLADLRAMLARVRPSLLILDTLARFSGIEENDNPAMTSFCGTLEDIIAETGCNILLLHHSNKSAGDCVEDPKELARALTQSAMRGASALAGCVRWGLLMAPMGAGLAVKIIGDEARGCADGSFVACRVGKKNAGAPEPRHYLGRDRQGLLYRVEAKGAEQAVTDATADAHSLTDKVREIEASGEAPPSASRSGSDFFGWGTGRTRRAVHRAVQLELLAVTPKTGGKGGGNVLRTNCAKCAESSGTLNDFNDNK